MCWNEKGANRVYLARLWRELAAGGVIALKVIGPEEGNLRDLHRARGRQPSRLWQGLRSSKSSRTASSKSIFGAFIMVHGFTGHISTGHTIRITTITTIHTIIGRISTILRRASASASPSDRRSRSETAGVAN
jgi:hypothetical protein